MSVAHKNCLTRATVQTRNFEDKRRLNTEINGFNIASILGIVTEINLDSCVTACSIETVMGKAAFNYSSTSVLM